MTYATVMVSLALDRSNEVRLEIAGQLVDRFGARVIGITAGEFSPPLYFTTGEEAQMVIDQSQAAIRKRTAGLEGEFRASMRNRTAVVEWRCAGEFPTGVIVQQAVLPTSSSSEPTVATLSPIPSCRPIRAISSCSWAGHCLLFRNPETGLICGAS